MSHLRWGNSQINVNFKGSRLLILWAQVDAAGDNGWQLLWDAAAAAAQSCQSCLTLCDPIEGSPPGSPSLGFSRQEHWSGLPFPSPMHESEKWKWSRSVVSDSQRPHGLQPTRLLRPWDFPGKSTGVGCHCLLQLWDSTWSQPANQLSHLLLLPHVIWSYWISQHACLWKYQEAQTKVFQCWRHWTSPWGRHPEAEWSQQLIDGIKDSDSFSFWLSSSKLPLMVSRWLSQLQANIHTQHPDMERGLPPPCVSL